MGTLWECASVHRLEPPELFDSGFARDELYRMCEERRDADQAAALGGLAGPAPSADIELDRQIVDGSIARELIVRSRYADLVVLGQSDLDLAFSDTHRPSRERHD